MFGGSTGKSLMVLMTVLFWQIERSSPECMWSNDWKLQQSQVSCPRRSPLLAVIEEKERRYRANCCDDEESLELEKEDFEQCETTDCLLGDYKNRNDLCSSLPQYISAEGERIIYEVSLTDYCRHEKSQKTGVAAVCCPKGSLAGLLTTTSAAELNEFPHMASTGGCGGTVYNKDYVITAAHCFINSTTGTMIPGPHQVILGTNLDELQSKTNTFPVGDIIVHEQCSFLKGHPERKRHYRRYYNDIALLKLKKSIDFRKYPNIRALEIGAPNFRADQFSRNAVILGFGATQLGRTSAHLQKANIVLREDSLCFDKQKGKLGEKQYEVMEYAEQFLCYGGIVNGSISNSAGRGDSGGPAICRDKNGNAILCGVASFGSEYAEEECAEHRNEKYCPPSVYEDVGYFHDWIVKYAGKQDPESLYRAKLYGERVPPGKYPHQVHITTRQGTSCGGTLISEDVVLTAAHCVVNEKAEMLQGISIVTRGDYVGGRNIGQVQTYTPAREGIVVLPTFSRYPGLDKLNATKSGRTIFKESPYIDDIAVIKLNRRVQGIRTQDVAKLPSSRHFRPCPAVELAMPYQQGRSAYAVLMQRDFNILSRRDCRKRYDRLHAVGVHVSLDSRRVMCAVELYSGGSTCDRELGGGLICRDHKTGQHVLCGIQTFRMCEMTLPNAFINVGMYLDLIEAVIGKRK